MKTLSTAHTTTVISAQTSAAPIPIATWSVAKPNTKHPITMMYRELPVKAARGCNLNPDIGILDLD